MSLGQKRTYAWSGVVFVGAFVALVMGSAHAYAGYCFESDDSGVEWLSCSYKGATGFVVTQERDFGERGAASFVTNNEAEEVKCQGFVHFHSRSSSTPFTTGATVQAPIHKLSEPGEPVDRVRVYCTDN